MSDAFDDPLRNPALFGGDEAEEAPRVPVAVARVVDPAPAAEEEEGPPARKGQPEDLFAAVSVGRVTDIFGDMSVEPVLKPKAKPKASAAQGARPGAGAARAEKKEERAGVDLSKPKPRADAAPASLFGGDGGGDDEASSAGGLFGGGDDDDDAGADRNYSDVYVPAGALESRGDGEGKVDTGLEADLLAVPSAEQLSGLEPEGDAPKASGAGGAAAGAGGAGASPAGLGGGDDTLGGDLDDELFAMAGPAASGDTLGDGFDFGSYIQQNAASSSGGGLFDDDDDDE